MNIKSNLLAGVSMTQIERAQGRFMRGPEDENGNGGHNQPGNTPPAGESGNQPDNSGATDELASFWEVPQEEAPAGGGTPPPSAPTGTPPAAPNQQPQQNAFATQLQADIGAIKFTPAIDEATAAEVAEGKFDSFNRRVEEAQRASVQQAVALSAKVFAEYGKIMNNQVKAMIETALGGAKDTDALETHFPAAKDPLARPEIERIFKQALVRTKNDRTKAVTLTKQMLARMMGTMAPDIDYTAAPRQPGDSAPAATDFTSLFNLRPQQ